MPDERKEGVGDKPRRYGFTFNFSFVAAGFMPDEKGVGDSLASGINPDATVFSFPFHS